MTDEIKTVLSTTSPTLPLTPLNLHFPLHLFSGCLHPQAAVTSPQWLHVFALASDSSVEARKGSSVAGDWSGRVCSATLISLA